MCEHHPQMVWRKNGAEGWYRYVLKLSVHSMMELGMKSTDLSQNTIPWDSDRCRIPTKSVLVNTSFTVSLQEKVKESFILFCF